MGIRILLSHEDRDHEKHRHISMSKFAQAVMLWFLLGTLTNLIMIFLSCSTQISRRNLKLSSLPHLSHLFQFTIYLWSYNSMLHSMTQWQHRWIKKTSVQGRTPLITGSVLWSKNDDSFLSVCWRNYMCYTGFQCTIKLAGHLGSCSFGPSCTNTFRSLATDFST
jgi:hypothetical protein